MDGEGAGGGGRHPFILLSYVSHSNGTDNMATPDAQRDGYLSGCLYEAFAQYGEERLVVRVTGFPTQRTMSLEALRTESRTLTLGTQYRVDELTLAHPLEVVTEGLRARKSERFGWSFMVDEGKNHGKWRFLMASAYKIDDPTAWKAHVKTYY